MSQEDGILEKHLADEAVSYTAVLNLGHAFKGINFNIMVHILYMY